jgi:disulfide bond formation protein DsbB
MVEKNPPEENLTTPDEDSPSEGQATLAAFFSDNKKFQVLSDQRVNGLVRLFNYIGLIVPLLVVLGAMTVQVFASPLELPCSHCNMERLAYFTLALGPALNLRFGSRPSHYAISLAGAMFLATVSIDMMVRVAQNVGPAGWGPVVLGLHVNSWSLIISIVAGVAIAIMLLWERQFAVAQLAAYRPGPKTSTVLKIAMIIVIAIISLDFVSVAFECGPGICPDGPPPTYPYWPF